MRHSNSGRKLNRTASHRSALFASLACALIDQAGLKGMRVGGAEVSTKHANFIVAHPGCRADDVHKLIKIIREKVYEKNQLVLESEVKMWP